MSRTFFLTFILILGPSLASAVYGSAAGGVEESAASALEVRADAHRVRLVRINCDRGQTLTRGLQHVAKELLIQFRGTCEEDVLIERDDVTLRGVGEAPTIVGTLTARQAIRITLDGFTVRDSPGSGIEIFEGAAANLSNLRVERTGNRGINIRNSVADLRDIEVDRAGNVALVIRASKTILTGRIVTTNSLFGVSVTEGSSAFLRGGSIEANFNDIGLTVQIASEMAVIQGSTIQANENLNTGIFIAASANISFEESSVESMDNGFLGLWVNTHGAFSGFSGTSSPIHFRGNGLAGALIEILSAAEFGPDTVISDNLFGGILASDSAVVLTDATVRDNAAVDISLRFGAKMTFEGESLDIGLPIDCDDTVLVRGSLGCGDASALEQQSASHLSWISRRPPTPLMPH